MILQNLLYNRKSDTTSTLGRISGYIGSNVKKNDIIEIRGIKIDKTARRVWVNGEETTFTSKEYDLLTFLAENPNRVFTKEELFREIWDNNLTFRILPVFYIIYPYFPF